MLEAPIQSDETNTSANTDGSIVVIVKRTQTFGSLFRIEISSSVLLSSVVGLLVRLSVEKIVFNFVTYLIINVLPLKFLLSVKGLFDASAFRSSTNQSPSRGIVFMSVLFVG